MTSKNLLKTNDVMNMSLHIERGGTCLIWSIIFLKCTDRPLEISVVADEVTFNLPI